MGRRGDGLRGTRAAPICPGGLASATRACCKTHGASVKDDYLRYKKFEHDATFNSQHRAHGMHSNLAVRPAEGRGCAKHCDIAQQSWGETSRGPG